MSRNRSRHKARGSILLCLWIGCKSLWVLWRRDRAGKRLSPRLDMLLVDDIEILVNVNFESLNTSCDRL